MGKLWSSILVAITFVESTAALTVQLDSSIDGEPPQIDYVVGSGIPLDLTLQLLNESSEDTLPIGLWQLSLAIAAEPSAIGEVQFISLGAPVDPLFGAFSEPGPPIDTPQREITVSDIDFSFEGVVIPSGIARNILQLGLTTSSQAEGLFTLTMVACDSEMPDQSSCWSQAGGEPELIPFDNPPSEIDIRVVELATIVVRQPGLIGDYNANGIVDAADYTVWRDHFGQLFLLDNEHPDAISPGKVDAEDYGFWAASFGATLGSVSSVSIDTVAVVPEPATILFAFGMAVASTVFRRPTAGAR